MQGKGRGILAWAALASAAAALGACASGGRDHGRELPPLRALISADALVFVSFDGDGDMRVSTDELDAGIAREFSRADVSHDGSLQPIEYQNWSNAALGGGLLPPYRLDFDRNVDNTITNEEFTTEMHARARDYDTDNDGVLTRTEFIRQLNAVRPPDAGQGEGGPREGGPPRRRRPG